MCSVPKFLTFCTGWNGAAPEMVLMFNMNRTRTPGYRLVSWRYIWTWLSLVENRRWPFSPSFWPPRHLLQRLGEDLLLAVSSRPLEIILELLEMIPEISEARESFNQKQDFFTRLARAPRIFIPADLGPREHGFMSLA